MPALDETKIRVILLDIEGTTTPIDFVYKTLFPYATRKLESFLRAHFQDPEIRSLIESFQAQYKLDEGQKLEPPVWHGHSDEERLRSSVAYARWLMARDSKCTALKSLQGRIWQEGFASEELRGEVYADVPPAFERWRRQKREICIYSSGSVLAQQNLFRTTAHGDLTLYISAFFDTNIGIKTDGESYTKIATSLRRAPAELLFISDAPKEIAAAQSAGMQAILCNRSGSLLATGNEGTTIENLDQILTG